MTGYEVNTSTSGGLLTYVLRCFTCGEVHESSDAWREDCPRCRAEAKADARIAALEAMLREAAGYSEVYDPTWRDRARALLEE